MWEWLLRQHPDLPALVAAVIREKLEGLECRQDHLGRLEE
jgi:hypothetical protein